MTDGHRQVDEFRKDAVHIALASRLATRQAMDDRGAGMVTLNKWNAAFRDTDVVLHEGRKRALETEHLRREKRIPEVERDIPRKRARSGPACAVEATSPKVARWQVAVVGLLEIRVLWRPVKNIARGQMRPRDRRET